MIAGRARRGARLRIPAGRLGLAWVSEALGSRSYRVELASESACGFPTDGSSQWALVGHCGTAAARAAAAVTLSRLRPI
jgi:hypothetical protein